MSMDYAVIDVLNFCLEVGVFDFLMDWDDLASVKVLKAGRNPSTTYGVKNLVIEENKLGDLNLVMENREQLEEKGNRELEHVTSRVTTS